MKWSIECSSAASLRDQMVVWMEDRIKYYTVKKSHNNVEKAIHEALVAEYTEASSFWRRFDIIEKKPTIET